MHSVLKGLGIGADRRPRRKVVSRGSGPGGSGSSALCLAVSAWWALFHTSLNKDSDRVG